MKTFLAVAVIVALALTYANRPAEPKPTLSETAPTVAAAPIAAAAPAEKRGSGRFVISQKPTGAVTVRELEQGVSYGQSIGASGGGLPSRPAASSEAAHKSATPKLKGTSLDRPSR